MSRRTLGAAAGVLVAVAVWALPSVGTLDPLGQRALAIIALGVVFWATDVLNAGITALLVLGLMLACGVPGAVALKGFASSAFWILVSVLFFGYAMDKSGLARRIAYRILQVFPATYTGILFAFLSIGFVLTLGIPSMTVRTAILMPIAWALVQAIGLGLPSRGSALIILSTFEMAVLPGCALLTGALWGPYLTGLFASQQIPLTWLDYARVMFVPTMIWCVLVLVGNLLVLRPEGQPGVTRDLASAELVKLGPMSRSETITAAIVAVSVLAWVTQPWHKVPAEAIGMLALSALFAGQVLTAPEIGTGIPWHLAIFVGGALSVSTVITTYKISDWMAGFIVPAVEPVAGSALLLVVVLALGVMAMRFVDPVGFITIAAFFLALVGVAPAWGVGPIVLAGIVVLPLHVFWFNYQNIWIVMTEGITKRQAYLDGDRIKLATVYAVATVLALGIAVGYWKLIGAL
ncbi:MAG: SLC13 family permease [Candidatus Latescibacterota bacterium]|jgi:anion transporter